MVRSCQIYLMSRQNESLKSKKTWTWSQLTNFPKKWRLEGVWCQQSGDLTLRRRIAARGNHVELKVTRRIGNCRDAMLLQLSHCKSSLASCPHCCDDMIVSKQFIRGIAKSFMHQWRSKSKCLCFSSVGCHKYAECRNDLDKTRALQSFCDVQINWFVIALCTRRYTHRLPNCLVSPQLSNCQPKVVAKLSWVSSDLIFG